MSDFIVVAGQSGAGRSQAGNVLEDLGWFVIDNLPPALIPKVAELAAQPGSGVSRVALVVGTGPYHDQVLPALDALEEIAGSLRILFLETSTDVLVRRYESSRRPHPLDEAGSLADAIEAERQLLLPVKERADAVIDTSDLNVHQLRDRILAMFGAGESASRMQTTLLSFGYKHGLPLDTDLVIDCRFLPNPHWVEELRPLRGTDPAVRDYVLGQDITEEFLDRLTELLRLLLPAYVAEGKSYLTIALGCTGGHHRSVAIVEEVARRLGEAGMTGERGELGDAPRVVHRDIER